MITLKEKSEILFKNKINILVLDDDETILYVHKEILGSMYINLHCCSTLKEAQETLAKLNAWHCWLLDINLGEGQSGLSLLDTNHNFLYSIIVSGLGSMRMAYDALKQGAMSVFDKDFDKQSQLYAEICKVSALSYVLGGKATQYLSTFCLLKDIPIISIEDWANKAGVTLRQLHRICALHECMTPRKALDLYYGLAYLLWTDISSKITDITLDPFFAQERLYVYEEHLASVFSKM